MKWIEKKHIVVLIFFVALIVRLLFVNYSAGIPTSDATSYDRLGLSVSEGKGYVESDGSPYSFRPPLYPLFLGIIYKFFGHSYFAVRMIQSVIGAFTCVFIFIIGKKICNYKVGILSAFLSVIYPPFIKSAELLLTELVFTFLLTILIFYLLKIQKDMKIKHCIIFGLALGVAALTRSAILLFPFFIVPIFVYSRKYTFLNKLVRYIIILLFFLLALLPWSIRNFNVYHRIIPIATQGGITFYSSYCPPDGIFGKLATMQDPIIREASKIISPVVRSEFLVKKTLDFILNNPKEVVILEFKKVLYLWAPFDWEIIGNRWFNFVYVIILPFFAFGLFLSFRKFKQFYPVLLPIVYIQIMSLFFYGSPRFRLPVEPFIFILSAIGILSLAEHFLKKRGKKYEAIGSNTSLQ